jgi:hypothetical protein
MNDKEQIDGRDITFKDMNNWSVSRLKGLRRVLRARLSAEIYKRDALKAEILFLQSKINEFIKE